MELSQEQRNLLKKGQILEVHDPAVGTVVLILQDVYEAMKGALEADELASLAKKATSEWARDNPY